ncbi:MAG: polyprenyl synthetase family protein [Candidatus Competibacteraceae bacterium]|jgi:geranylgeranyl pyrophosphate synthase|nr:polyprenyl synthetase family protein [Candidatus Competibacteraceae bacterium]
MATIAAVQPAKPVCDSHQTVQCADLLSSVAPGNGKDAWDWAVTQLPAVDNLLKRVANHAGPLQISARYHLAASGGQFRARLALAMAYCLGIPAERIIPAAAACELLHNASLVHDDLQDRDTMRRGQYTVWKRFGEDIALNLGDYFLTQAQGLLLETPSSAESRLQLTRLFTRRISESIRGQVLSARFTPEFTVADYESMVRAKTGAFFALPAECAMVLADTPSTLKSAVVTTLEQLGVAYQIQDDLSDFMGSKVGREAGSDLRAGVVNAVLVQCAVSQQQPLLEQLMIFLRQNRGQATTTEITRWARLLCESTAFEQTLNQLESVQTRVTEHLKKLPTLLAQTIIEAGGQFKSASELRPSDS